MCAPQDPLTEEDFKAEETQTHQAKSPLTSYFLKPCPMILVNAVH